MFISESKNQDRIEIYCPHCTCSNSSLNEDCDICGESIWSPNLNGPKLKKQRSSGRYQEEEEEEEINLITPIKEEKKREYELGDEEKEEEGGMCEWGCEEDAGCMCAGLFPLLPSLSSSSCLLSQSPLHITQTRDSSSRGWGCGYRSFNYHYPCIFIKY